MKRFILLFGLFGCLPAGANDGVFRALGNTLIPLKETSIRMKKEILSLERQGEWMQVDIYFEFFNPGAARELTVGFVTPPAYGDFSEEEANHPQVKDFMVMVGNRLLPFKITRLEQSGFRLQERLAGGQDFVYHFTVPFAPGVTVIRHSYRYWGGASVEEKYNFDYRLTTGTTWGGSAIEDFELNINMGEDVYFSVPASFGKANANWTVVGVGRISPPLKYNPYQDETGGQRLCMVFLKKGKLQLRQAQFRPVTDLSLVIYQPHNEVMVWMAPGVENPFRDLASLTWTDSLSAELARLSSEQLRLYRNLNYARRGLVFRDEKLQKVFLSCFWYIPDPAMKAEAVPDYYVSAEMMKLILAEEKKRNTPLPLP